MTILAPFLLSLLLLTQSEANSLAPENSAPLQVTDKEQTLKLALADYEAAAAMKNNDSPDAQTRFRAALAGFQSLVLANIRSAPLYYNLANTQLSLGDIGRAIVNYRRAARLSPGDENIQRNLQFARKLCEVQIPQSAGDAVIETIFFWHFDTSLATRLKWFLGSYCLVWLLLGLRLFVARRIPTVFWTTVTATLIASASGVSIGWDTYVAANRFEGVVVTKNAVLRKGNGDYYDQELDRALQPGVEFLALETRKDVDGHSWYHIRLEGGKSGWLRDTQVEII
jgi:tetratricopeptide (TPR) repeat protein